MKFSNFFVFKTSWNMNKNNEFCYINDDIKENWEHFKQFYNYEASLCLPEKHYGWKYKLPELLVHNYLKLDMSFIKKIKLACFKYVRSKYVNGNIELHFDRQSAFFVVSTNIKPDHDQLQRILFIISQKNKIDICIQKSSCQHQGYHNTKILLTRSSSVPRLYKKIFNFYILQKNKFTLFILLHYLPINLCHYILQNFKFNSFQQFLNKHLIHN